MKQSKFVIDAMLGTIAKKLRMFGFDCKYFSSMQDDELIELARREGRILITKDRPIIQKCKKSGVSVVGVFSDSERDQLAEIAKQSGLGRYSFDASKAHCPLCNGKIDIVEKSSILNDIPERIASNVELFWRCQDCGHIYWEGTHISSLRKLIDEINADL